MLQGSTDRAHCSGGEQLAPQKTDSVFTVASEHSHIIIASPLMPKRLMDLDTFNAWSGGCSPGEEVLLPTHGNVAVSGDLSTHQCQPGHPALPPSPS